MEIDLNVLISHNAIIIDVCSNFVHTKKLKILTQYFGYRDIFVDHIKTELFQTFLEIFLF